MQEVAEQIPDPLVFTEAAASKVKELIEDENNEALMLRVFISGGGCSGLSYTMKFEEKPAEHDKVFEIDGI